MVDVSDSPVLSLSSSTNEDANNSFNNNSLIDVAIPEDNVERLRNIRDMFENSDTIGDEQQLQKVEKVQPSDKIKERLANSKYSDELLEDTSLINDDSLDKLDMSDSLENLNNHCEEFNEPPLIKSTSVNNSSCNSPVSSLSVNDEKTNDLNSSHENNNFFRFQDGATDNVDDGLKTKEPIIVFTELNSVKEKFENFELNHSINNDEPKQLRSITPPRDGLTKTVLENEPVQRSADIVSSSDKTEEIKPETGLARSRKEMFQQINENNTSTTSPPKNGDQNGKPRVKSITPPRIEEKRLLKEKTPERDENVIREQDKSIEILPTAGTAKQTAAIFTNSGSRIKSIENSGITIEGELAEKGIAKSRLAMFNNINEQQQQQQTSTNGDLETEIMKNASGIAKERLNLFKNLEQSNSRTSPPKEIKKLKEFTPPPQLDAHQLQQRQYIIIDKESNNENGDVYKETHNANDYVPEAGIAKNRMKQYLDHSNNQVGDQIANGTNLASENGEKLPEKGTAKSLVAKWKSMENIKDKETSPELNPNLAEINSLKQQRALNKDRQITPPPVVETLTSEADLPQSGTAKSLLSKWQNIDKEKDTTISERRQQRQITPPPADLVNIEKGFAKNALANYESTPVESNINSQYNNDEEIIPSPGLAKQLKSKFQTFEKEANKIETSSSKLNYIPKKFTSSTPSKATNGHSTNGNTNGNGQANQSASNGNSEKCSICDKTVYAMEKIEADKKIYHKLCFKCTMCNCTLKLGNYSSIKEKLYCTPHYIQLFARNGNYDEGFGLENYKKKWLNRPDNTNITA